MAYRYFRDLGGAMAEVRRKAALLGHGTVGMPVGFRESFPV